MNNKLLEWADAGDADYDHASYELGKIYREGKGVEQDYAKAIDYFKKAIYHQRAVENILDMCQQGQGVPQNDKDTLDFVINMLDKRFTNIYTTDSVQRMQYFNTRRSDEFTIQYEICLEWRRILNLARKLKEKNA